MASSRWLRDRQNGAFYSCFLARTSVWAELGGLDATGGGEAFAPQPCHLVDLQRRQLANDTREQEIRQLRIPGQAWAVQIRGHQTALHSAVDAVTQAIAGTADHARQWLRIRTQYRSPTVVFEARQPLRQSRDQRL